MDVITPELQVLLSRLEFFSMLRAGYKVNLHDMSFADGNSYYDALNRRGYKEDKKKVLSFIREIISQTEQALILYKDTRFHPLILEVLKRARDGISTLITTYQNYPIAVAEIRVILTSIKLLIE